MRRLLTSLRMCLLLGVAWLQCAAGASALGAEDATPTVSDTWRIVLCISETQPSEATGTECVVVLRNTSDAPLAVSNGIVVKQYVSREDGRAAEPMGAQVPGTQTADPRIVEVQELWRKTASIELSIEGPYTASYVPPMVIWHQGLLQRVEVRPAQPYYKGVILPGTMFQAGQYKVRARLRLADHVLAESNTQIVRMARGGATTK